MSSVIPASDTDEGSTSVPFSVWIAVRTYELDALGHLNQAVYHSYAEHGRVELFRAAGCTTEAMFAEGFAPVLLSSEARYLRELRAGDEVEVATTAVFGAGRTFAMNTRLTKPDGTLAATVNGTMGLLDMKIRRLLVNPRERIVALATNPALLAGTGPVESTKPATVSLQEALDALADPVRHTILRELAATPDWVRACGTFDLPVTKATRSHHFAVLRAAGLIEQRDEDSRRLNRLRKPEFDARFPGLLDAVLREELPQ